MKHAWACLFFVIFALLWTPNGLYGQSSCGEQAINEAEKNYLIGKFENTLNSLNGCLQNEGFNTNQKENAYRILAWTYIAIDSTVEAKNAVIQLLSLNPSYHSRSYDPLLFQVMVSEIRLGFFDVLVTSVSKKPENVKEAPATVMVITEEEIQQRGYIDLVDMLSDLPGFDISRTFGNTYANILQRGYRSNNTDRTLFLIDGVEDNSLWSNVAFVSRQYPVSNIKRVEVVYGPASTMYGANAFVGVINVITKDPNDYLTDKSYYVSADVGMGNYDTKYGELTIATKKNIVSFSATGRVFSSNEVDLSNYKEYDFNPDDYDDIDYESMLRISGVDSEFFDSPYFQMIGDSTAGLTAEGLNFVRNNDKNLISTSGPNNGPIQYSNISDHYYFSSKLNVNNFTLAYQFWQKKQSTGNYGTDNSRAGPAYGGIWSPSQSFLNATYNRDINDKLSITNISQYRLNRVSESSATVILNNYANGSLDSRDLLNEKKPFWRTSYFYQLSRQFRNELKINYQPISGLDIVSGVEIRNSSVQGNYRKLFFDGITTQADTFNVIEEGISTLDTVPGGNNFGVYDYGFYLQGSYDFHPDVNLTLGGRYDHNQIRATEGYGAAFNPRIALVLTPGKMIFKGIYARAIKDASFFQKYATADTRLFNNPTLKPEIVNNYETSVGYKWNKRLFIDASLYYSSYSGAVTSKETTIDDVTSDQFNAEGELKIYGLQASANYKVSNYTVFGNYTYVNSKVEVVDALGIGTGVFIKSGDIASHRINLGVNALYFEKLNINLRANYASRRPVGPETSVRSNILADFPSFALLNGAVTYKNLLPGLNVQLVVNNILNHEYSDPGIRDADGIDRPYRTPQRGIFTMFKLQYEL